MKRFFILAAVSALAVAKPELYKEQEDFQFSRSSSDDGSKSGYYDAQRGNMGGNYERAHNMDALAQNQMSGLVTQVQGELGDGVKTKSGNVYSSANSKGIYGSGHFDLSNLAGRNFQEGTYYDNSQSRSSSSQSASMLNRNAYANSNSQSSSNYRGYQTADAQTQTGDLQTSDISQGRNQYYNNGQHSSGFQAQSGFQEHGEYDHSNANSHSGYGSNVRTRLISATPVRIVITPGGRVAIPVAAQTYDTTYGLSAFDQNAQNNDAVVNTNNYQGSLYKPSDAKQYESSYRYHKKWEKHDTVPTSFSIAIPTGESIPKNSELLEDTEANTQYNARSAQNERSNSASSRYSGVKSSSSQSQYQTNHNSQRHSDSSSSNSNALTQAGYNSGSNHGISLDLNSQTGQNFGSHSDLNSQVENLGSKPKSYQSSYSYHKSWERQGDPYVIKPASGGDYDSQASQRLTSSTNNHGYSAYHQSGSRYNQNQADCDENGHLRVARSTYTDNQHMQQQSLDDDGEIVQQLQNTWQNLEDTNTQSQDIWTQQNVGQLQSQNKWDTLEDLNQQIQNNWNQQSQNQFVNFEGFHEEPLKLDPTKDEKQSENKWDNLENLNQQSQNNWEQQSQHQFGNFESFNQQLQNLDQSNVESQSENKLNSLNQQSQNNWNEQPIQQESQNKLDNLEDLGQQSQTNWEQQNVGQESNSNWEKFENFNQQSQRNEVGQSLYQNTWTKFEDLPQQNQNSDINSQTLRKYPQNFLEGHDQDRVTEQIQVEQLVPNKTDNELFTSIGKEHNDKRPHKVESPWDKFDILDVNNKNKTENKTESNDFYWHHLSNHGVDDHKINKLNANGDIISELITDTQRFNTHQDSEQRYDSVGVLNNYNNPNTHYSYSNEFINPTIYDKRNLNSDNQNSYQVHEANHNIHNSYSNRNSQVIWQEHAIDSDNYSQINQSKIESHSDNSKLSSLWSKFDNIEKQSSFTTNDMIDFSQLYNTYPESSNNSSHQFEDLALINIKHNLSTSDSKLSIQKLENLPSENPQSQNTSQQKIEHTLPQMNKDIENNVDLPKEAEASDFEVLEKSQDIGRGDIGVDDFFSQAAASDSKPHNISDDKIKSHSETTLETMKHNKNQGNDSHNQLNILGLDQKNTQIERQRNMIINQTNSFNITGPIQNQEYQTNQNIFRQDIVVENQQDHPINLQNRNTTLHKVSNLEQKSTSSRQDFMEQNKFFEQNLHNFEQENVQNHPNVNFEQQNLHNFEQENAQEFVQQYENFEQMNLDNFEQENTQDFVQNNENLKQENLHEFGQENKHDFEQQIQNAEQQNLFNFRQEVLTNNTDNFERQIFHNFSQQGKQISSGKMENLTKFDRDQLEQNVQHYGRENKNQEVLQPENVNNFWSQNEELNQQNVQELSPLNNADVVFQKNTFPQYNSRNIEKQNEKSVNITKSHEVFQPNPINELQLQASPNIVKEDITEQQNVTEDSPHYKEELHTIVEHANEKPGFWKSLGNKFSNAKNTVASWFKS